MHMSFFSSKPIRVISFTVFSSSILLTVATLFVAPVIAQNKQSFLTPQQRQFTEQKQNARASQAKTPDHQVSGKGHTESVKPGAPVKQRTEKVRLTKPELQARWKEEWESVQEELGHLGAEQAAQLRAQYSKTKEEIDNLPANRVVEIEIPVTEVGEHSIHFSSFTYNSSGKKLDPINVIFYNVGSAWDVQFDLQNWTSIQWKTITDASTQWVYIWDKIHYGGQDVWRKQDYQLAPVGSANAPWPRYHIRLFGSFTRDSHSPGFGAWTIGDAHHDDMWHDCTDDWEVAEAMVRASFKDSNGNPMWFVGTIWQTDLGNAGNYQCAYNDGKGTLIELLY